jgi:hypothetical protein
LFASKALRPLICGGSSIAVELSGEQVLLLLNLALLGVRRVLLLSPLFLYLRFDLGFVLLALNKRWRFAGIGGYAAEL